MTAELKTVNGTQPDCLTESPLIPTAPATSQASIDKVLGIVEKATTTAMPATVDELNGRWAKIVPIVKRHQRFLTLVAVGLILVMPILFLVRAHIEHQLFILLMLTVVILVEMTVLLILLSEILTGLPFVNQFRKQPYVPFLRSVHSTATFHLQFLHELAQCEKQAVQYVLRHYQLHRVAMERRASLLSGSIDKIGVFPALAAVVLLWVSLSKAPFGNWLSVLVPIIFLLHLLNILAFAMQQRMDRVIALLEVSVATR